MSKMPDIFLPTLHTFAMKNPFTGSCGSLRFKIVPKVEMQTPKEVDMAARSIFVEYWHGPLCYERSQIEGNATFPMSEEGRAAIKAWLEDKL